MFSLDRILTERLTIRRFKETDMENLFRLLSDPEVMRYIEPPYTREQTVSFLNSVALRQAPLIWAVDDLCDKFVGYVIFHPYDDSSYEIGWLLRKEHWHKGYATELTRALIEAGEKLQKDLVIECHPEQAATVKIALGNGFAYVGKENGCNLYRRKVVQN